MNTNAAEMSNETKKIEEKIALRKSTLESAISYLKYLCIDFNEDASEYSTNLEKLKNKLDAIELTAKDTKNIIRDINLLKSVVE